jgi:hypothetical protein
MIILASAIVLAAVILAPSSRRGSGYQPLSGDPGTPPTGGSAVRRP